MSKKQDKYVNIGGQAVIEGVMMKSPERMALSVRDEEGTIQFVVEENEKKPSVWSKIPIIRGCINFFFMLISGVKIMNKAIYMYDSNGDMEDSGGVAVFLGVVFGLILAVALFILLPTFLASFFNLSGIWANLMEGVIRIIIFLGYMFGITVVPDMKRVFMYHGAEHKTIACYEAGEDLVVENVKKQSRLHPRCGTSFLFLVMIVSILVYSVLVWTDVIWLRFLLRILFLPVVAGAAYEVLKALSKSEHICVRAIRWPGLMLQKLTTKEPTDDMMEVAIVSFKGALLEQDDLEQWEKGSDGIAFTYFEDEADGSAKPSDA